MKQMPTILCVEKLGAIKELNVKNVNEDELYKKASLKTEKDLINFYEIRCNDTIKSHHFINTLDTPEKFCVILKQNFLWFQKKIVKILKLLMNVEKKIYFRSLVTNYIPNLLFL